ncbi:MAG: 4-alpha-glucanotransferase [Vicinamibacterales bacterium]
MARHAGLQLPLFSIRSRRDWGIGECPDLAPLARWMAAGGFDRLLLLPVGTMAPGESSPYSAVSTLAIDPVFIAVEAVEDVARAGGADGLAPDVRERLETARASAGVRYADVRRAKRAALDRGFDRFVADEWAQHTPRAAALAAYIARERDWLDDYALFQAIADATPPGSWRDWPAPLRDRDPRVLDDARRQLMREVLRHQYLQWIAETQWQAARTAARQAGVTVIGDLPFVAGLHSADVWSRQAEFALDVSTGVPPDAFSATGQDWGLPYYRWDVIARTGFAAMRQRIRRMAALYDGLRVDHLVGLYRTFGRDASGEAFFSPADEAAQAAQGEAVLRLLLESPLAIIAEDLGTVPDFVRASMARLGVPGCRVLRWERDWHAPGQPFLDPAGFPDVSAALTGTHDTETLAVWWQRQSADERAAARRWPVLARTFGVEGDLPWGDAVRDALLRQAYAAGSRELFIPMADVFGWTDRINTPATVGDHNWTWRLPWPIDDWLRAPEPARRAAACRGLARESGRLADPG